MKFSIVITTYNRVSLLRRAVESALAQTVPCEVVVVDDHSSDGTQAYLEGLGDRIVYCRNSENLGHSRAVNKGVEVAQGDWVKLVDDDDYLAPNCIEKMSSAIALRPEAVLLSCQAAQVTAEGTELSRTRQVGSTSAFYVPQEDIHYGMLLEQLPFGTPIQVAFQRAAFQRSGGWDSSLDTNCDDIDSWIRIAQYGDAIFVNQCLSYRTVWPGAYNAKFTLQKRLETNILMKEKIYALVSQRYRALIPDLETIRQYVSLHWAVVALKQRNLTTAAQAGLPALGSMAAWQLLLQARRGNSKAAQVRQIPLSGTQSRTLVQAGRA